MPDRTRDTVTTSATDFKQHVGKYLDAARTGRVVIERQGRPTAVLLSVEEYETLNPSALRVIDTLSSEFEALLARMQRRPFHQAMDRAFEAEPGRATRAPRRRRRPVRRR